MKAIHLYKKAGPEAFVYEDAPMPTPGEGEVLIAVRAAGVTPSELKWMPTWTQMNGEPRPFPIRPGHEFSGVVHALGAGVSDLAVGDEVFGMNDWFGDGAQVEFCRARAVDIAIKPKSLDFAQAAVTPISALTAWQGLVDRADLQSGQRVLIHGASGGVGLFAVQIAVGRGAYVIATASAENLDFVRGLGADEAIDYKATRFEDVAGQVDVVFDTVGGETLLRSWDVLKPNGTMVTIAAAGEAAQDQRTKDAFFIVEPSRSQLTKIAELIDAGELRPVVDAVFPLSEARSAYEHSTLRGKMALTMNS